MIALLLLVAAVEEDAPSFAVAQGVDVVAPTRGLVAGFPLLGVDLALDLHVWEQLSIRIDGQALTTLQSLQPARNALGFSALIVLPIDEQRGIHALLGLGGDIAAATYFDGTDTFDLELQLGARAVGAVRWTFAYGFFFEGSCAASVVTAPFVDRVIIAYPGARLAVGWSI